MTPILGPCGCSELATFGDSVSDTGNNALVLRPNVTDTPIPPNTFVARAIFDTMRTDPSAFRFPNLTDARAARPTCRRAEPLCWAPIIPPPPPMQCWAMQWSCLRLYAFNGLR